MSKISLIIPVFNSEKYLPILFNSINDQNYLDYEVIIINDGSTDNSLDIIKKYITQNKRIKVFTIKNSGPGIARKIGFEKSTGDLLFFVDSDDKLPSNDVLNNINRIYAHHKFDIMFFKYVRKCNEKESIVCSLPQSKYSDGLYGIESIKNDKILSALWCKIFVRKKMSIKFFVDANNFEDCYTTYNYLNVCKNFYFYDGICYYSNRDLATSLSKKNDVNKMLKTIAVLKQAYSKTFFKKSIVFTLSEYYLFARRSLDKWKITKSEKRDVLSKLEELHKMIKEHNLFVLNISLKHKLMYLYYKLRDEIYEK